MSHNFVVSAAGPDGIIAAAVLAGIGFRHDLGGRTRRDGRKTLYLQYREKGLVERAVIHRAR